jgi:hypothetical protein
LILNGEPGGTRTRDPLLKRQMLYRLSYRLPRETASSNPRYHIHAPTVSQ